MFALLVLPVYSVVDFEENQTNLLYYQILGKRHRNVPSDFYDAFRGEYVRFLKLN